jgi:hypothetical protein
MSGLGYGVADFAGALDRTLSYPSSRVIAW